MLVCVKQYLLNRPTLSRHVLQGSPFILNVKRKLRHHSGTFHCCSFCSSGGAKEARCGCPGTMPGSHKRSLKCLVRRTLSFSFLSVNKKIILVKMARFVFSFFILVAVHFNENTLTNRSKLLKRIFWWWFFLIFQVWQKFSLLCLRQDKSFYRPRICICEHWHK